MTVPAAAGFVDDLLAEMPDGSTMPTEIVAVMRRMESEGFVHTYSSGGRELPLYPVGTPLEGRTSVAFVLDDRKFMTHWTDRPGADADVFVFVATGGDGSRAGIWRDDKGAQHFVHLGSGSGSVWAGVVTDDASVLLRLLAIGYTEVCYPEALDGTPMELWQEEAGYPTLAAYEAYAAREQAAGRVAFPAPPRPPTRFQEIVAAVTGAPIPATGAELLPPPYPSMGDVRSDPFNRWLDNGTPGLPAGPAPVPAR